MFLCHIIGIEPQFENIISNGPYISMAAGQNDKINSVINCLTVKSTWDDLILYHEGPFDVKESRGMDLKLCYNTFKFKEALLSTAFFSTSIIQDFQDSPDDEEDTRSSQENMNDLEEEYQARALLAKSKSFFKKGTQSLPSGKNKGLTAETYDWDEEEVSSNNNEVTKVKVLMALADVERVYVGKESARNDYLCIDLNYVEEQRNNIMSKHRNLVQELNTCKEQLLVLKQAKLDLLTMHHANTKILKENQNLRNELKELTSITEAWLNISSKVNQCICKQIPTQKKKILGIDQLTEDTFSFGPKDLIFVKSLADNVSITNSNKPRLSKAEKSTLSNYDTADESLVCSIPLPPLKKLDGPEPISGPKTIKSILKSKSTFKAETLKGIIINKPSSAPSRGSKSSSSSKTNSAPASKLNNVKIYNDHRSDDCVYYPICEICGSYDHDTHGHNKIISLRKGIKPRNPQHVIKNCETCGSNVHTTSDHNDIEWFRKREALQAKKAESFKASKTESSSALRSKTPTKRLIHLKEAFQSTKNVKDLLKKYDINGSSVITLMVPPNMLGHDLNGKAINETQYRGMTGSLMCLTKSRRDIQVSLISTKDIKQILRNPTLLLLGELFIKNYTLKGDIEFHFIPTQYQLADIFIKLPDKLSFKRMIDELCMLNIDSKPEASVLTEEN
ncbi:hypothetical protein Tco_1272513 [Tanacetum coccineum]